MTKEELAGCWNVTIWQYSRSAALLLGIHGRRVPHPLLVHSARRTVTRVRIICQFFGLQYPQYMYIHCVKYTEPHDSRNWEAINYRGRVPVGIQAIVGLLPDPTPSSPDPLHERDNVSRIRSDSRIKFRNGDVGHFHFLPCLRFISLEYLVE